MRDTSPLHIAYVFSCRDVQDAFVVTAFTCVEELNRPFRLTLELTAEDEATECTDLLGRDVRLSAERNNAYERTFCGLVDRVTLLDTGRTLQSCSIEIVPALFALSRTEDTRIFQGKTALEVTEEVLSEGLAPYGRKLDLDQVDGSRLETRDYCVQYRESNLDFVHRLLEEEGIGYHFVHDAPERLTLFDDNRHLERVTTIDGAPVRYDPTAANRTGPEPILRFEGSSQCVSTSVTTRDHDWTRATTCQVEATAAIEPASTPPASTPPASTVYEHGLERHLTIHEREELAAAMLATLHAAVLPGGLPPAIEHRVRNLDGAVFDSFTSNNAEDRARLRAESLARDSRTFEGCSLVRSICPGATFELIGHPTLGVDGEYFVTKATHSTALSALDRRTTEWGETNYGNRFECRLLRTPWRPERATHKPRIHSIQTAKVTGPAGLDVHTDPHGRIRVRFPWDRAGESLVGNSSCWIRVSQIWAGPGSPGFLFIPRVGMEVIVAFIEGDPDRPLVTGCVYNGQNATPGLLPVQATKSIIRTRTVPHGSGYNELSFEDAMGMERIHIRAERDLDELVQNNHHTHVKHLQTNVVGGDQHEVVDGHQDLVVQGQRTKTINGRHTEATGDRRLQVNGSDLAFVDGSYQRHVHGSALITVDGGEYVAKASTAVALVQNDERFIEMSSEGEQKGILIDSKGATVHVAEDEIELRVGESVISITASSVRVNGKIFPSPPGQPEPDQGDS